MIWLLASLAVFPGPLGRLGSCFIIKRVRFMSFFIIHGRSDISCRVFLGNS